MVDFLRFEVERHPLLQLPNPISGAERDILGGELVSRRVIIDIDDVRGTAVVVGCKPGDTSVETEGAEKEGGEEEATRYKVERHDWLGG